MDNLLQAFSKFLFKALDILLLTQPLKTAVAFTSGVGIYCSLIVIGDLRGLPFLNIAKWFHFSMLMIFVVNIPLLLKLFFKTDQLNESERVYLDELKSAEREGADRHKIEELRFKLLEKMLRNLNSKQQKNDSTKLNKS
jgi:hypothetical protein